MAKFIIYDPEVCTKSDLKVYGVPSERAYPLNRLTHADDYPEDQRITIIPGNSYMMIGQSCYKYIKDKFHLGLRKVNYKMVCDLPKVSTRDGVNFTFIAKVIGTTRFKPRLDYFLSKSFNQHLRPLPEENKIITKDLQVGMDWMRKWLDGTFTEPKYFGWFGLDYETADVTNLNHKDICGVGIASINRGIFIDFRFRKSDEEWEEFKKIYIEFNLKFRDRNFAYNSKFEFDRTDETFEEYIDFQDAGAMNIVDARQMIFYPLKFTAQYYTGVSSWDDDFDSFAEYLGSVIFKNYKSLEALLADEDMVNRFKKHFIDEEDWQEWIEIARMKPEYWGDRFWLQTSRNLGRYCILDSYYTLMIAVVQWPKYPELANILTCDNLRLGQQLMATGCFIDDEKRDRLRAINFKYQAYSLFKLIAAYYQFKIRPVDQTFLDKLSPGCRILVTKGFNPTKGMDFWKDIASQLVDEKSETYVNDYNAIALLGDEVGNKLINFGRRYKKPLVNFSRSKKMKEDLDRYRRMLYSEEDKKIILDYASEISKIKSNKSYNKRLEILKSSELWDKEFDEVDTYGEYEFGGKLRTLEQIANTINNSKRNRNGWFKFGTPTEQKSLRNFLLNVFDGYPASFASNMYTKLKFMKIIFGAETVNDPEITYKLYLEYCSQIENEVLSIYKQFEIDRKDVELSEEALEKYLTFAKLSTPNNLRKFIKNLSNLNRKSQYNNRKFLQDVLNKDVSSFDKYLKCLYELVDLPNLNKYKYSLREKDYKYLSEMVKTAIPRVSDYHHKDYTDMMYDRLRDCAHSGFSRWSKAPSYQDIKLRTNKFGFTFGESTPYEIVSTCMKAMYIFCAYNKELTYLDGIFHKGRMRVSITDKDLRYKYNPEGEYVHINTKFNICRLKTKRSSSGFHTIPHATAIKGIINSPKGYAMSYFDVSQAEP